jgi:hypothetical protein
MSVFNMMPDPDNQNPSLPTLISASRFVVQTWLFRCGLVAICFLTVAVLNWLVRDSADPLLEALPAAIGLVLGFGAMHLIDVGRRKYPK